MERPPKFAYRTDGRGNFVIPETVESFLASAWKGGHPTKWDPEKGAWKRDATTHHDSFRSFTLDDLQKECRELERVVPGLKVVDAEFVPARGTRRDTGYVWYTWTKQAMDDRLQELWEKHGVADCRIELFQCHWTESSKQLRIPGVVEVEPRKTVSPSGLSAYTRSGLILIDRGFCQRIMHPNRGGKEAEFFSGRVCHVGNEKWFVATRGDSKEILSLEIQGSPLDDRTKENLLHNLECYPRDETKRDRFFA